MKPSEIIDLARRQTGCTTDIVTIEEAYRFLNFIIEDFGAEIRLSDSGYGLKTRTLDIVAGQNTYDYQDDEDSETQTFAMDKILKVGVLESNGKYREIPVRFVTEIKINDTISSGEITNCFYNGNKLVFTPTPASNGQVILYGYDKNYELDGKSISFITMTTGTYNTFYRSPEQDVYGATEPICWTFDTGSSILHRYTATEKPAVGTLAYSAPNTESGRRNYEIGAYTETNKNSESNIWIPARWHHILVEGLKYRMYGNMGVGFDNSRMAARQFYDSEKLKAIAQLTDRGQMAEEGGEAYLDYLA